MKPNAQLIPCGARVYAMCIESTEIYKNHRVGIVSGFDLSPFNQFSSFEYSGYHIEKSEHKALSKIAPIFEFDFLKDTKDESVEITFEVTESGLCHAVVYWYELQLDKDTIISTAPYLPQLSCWKQAVQLLPQPINLTKGETFKLMAHHDNEALWFTTVSKTT